MTLDEQFRAAFDNLTARLNRDLARHFDAAVEELAAEAEKQTAIAEAAQAEELERRSREVWAEAEKITKERLTAALTAEHAELMDRATREARAEAEKITTERLTATLAAEHAELMERATREARAEAEKITTERLTAALAAEHAELMERATREARAEAEKLTTERLSAALNAERAGLVERAAREAWAEAERVTSERLSATFETRQAQGLLDVRTEAERVTSARVSSAAGEAEARARRNFQTADIEAGQRLVQAFHALDSGQSLSDILNVLVTAAKAEAPRVALFLSQNARLKSVRHEGFERQAAPPADLEISVAEAAVIADAVAARASVVAGDGGAAKAPAFARLPSGRSAVAVPLLINGEVAAVLYADQGVEREASRPSWSAVVEILACHTARVLEALTAQRLAKTLADRPGPARPRPVPRPPADPPAAPSPGGGAPASRAEPDRLGARRYA